MQTLFKDRKRNEIKSGEFRKMKEWYKPADKKPSQGKKVLCMSKENLYVAQRFGDYWFSIPFADSARSFYLEPELWQEIDFPNGLNGEMKVFCQCDGSPTSEYFFIQRGKELNMDEFEKHDPVAFELLIISLKKSFEKSKNQ